MNEEETLTPEDQLVHERIRTVVSELGLLHGSGASPAYNYPELAELMGSALDAIEESLPFNFRYRGKIYQLKSRPLVQIEIFDLTHHQAPIIRGLIGSSDFRGHGGKEQPTPTQKATA